MASPATLQRRAAELASEAGIRGLSHARVKRIFAKHRDTYQQLMAATQEPPNATSDAEHADTDPAQAGAQAPGRPELPEHVQGVPSR